MKKFLKNLFYITLENKMKHNILLGVEFNFLDRLILYSIRVIKFIILIIF